MDGLMLGFDEFEKDMQDIINQASDPEVRREMLEAMAEPIVKDAKSRVVYDTGNLHDGIVTKYRKSKPDEIEIGWTNKAYYGRFLERGYHHAGSKKFIKLPHIRPAYNAKIGEGIQKALDVFRIFKYYTK